jgi:hypothetical protein
LKTAFATNTAGVYTATGHATFDVLTVADLQLWMGMLPQFALPNAAFYFSQSFFSSVFRRLAAAGGGNTIQTRSGDLAYACSSLTTATWRRPSRLVIAVR